jgi:hypothetical protein|nr:hypothetical protein [Ferrovum sp.]
MTRTVGIAYFDEPDSQSLTGGWCSIGGGRAKSFASAQSELDPSVLWVTNLGFTSYIESQMSCVANMRGDSFFRQTVNALSSELSIQPGVGQNTIPDTISVLSGIAQRVMAMSEAFFPDMRIGFTLHDSIYDHLQINDINTDHGAHYQREIQSAFQENSMVAYSRGGWVSDAETVKLIPNRVSHAESVLSFPIPSGAVTAVDSPMSQTDFLESGRLGLAHVVIDPSRALEPDLLAIGSQISGTSIFRDWMTQPEMFFMMEEGVRFEIKGAIFFDKVAEAPQLPPAMLANAVGRTSYSAGILAENFLNALMSKRKKPKTKKGARTSYFFPSRAVFLRAADRMLSFALAKQVASQGFRVSGYGFGTVTVRAQEHEIRELMEAGADMGFMVFSTGTGKFAGAANG